MIAGAVLITAALLCLWWTPGDWWIASPLRSRWYLAAGVLASFLALLGWACRSGAKASRLDQVNLLQLDAEEEYVLVIYASETGFAESLAHHTRDRLQDSGRRVELAPIDAITTENLVDAKRALFIASTAGQGDPPEHAMEFFESVMQQAANLNSLHFGVLALGDRSYDEFCEFGHQLSRWLRTCGAQSLFDVIEVDDGDEVALEHWESRIESISEIHWGRK